MKALSVKQPWASLICLGLKTIETRKWATEYRGKLLIVAAKGDDEAAMVQYEQFLRRNMDYIPRGEAICIAELVNCRPMMETDEIAAMCKVYDRAYAWVLLDLIMPITPFRVKGRLGLFDVEVF